jgi:hypothetical protein
MAFRLAKRFCKEPGISVDGIIERIQAEDEGIDRETAWMAADQAVNERKENELSRSKENGWMILLAIGALGSAMATTEWKMLLLPIVGISVIWLVRTIWDHL